MSDELYVVCPKCGNRYDFSFLDRKKEIICPFCGQVINTTHRDTEVIIKIGEGIKQRLSLRPELENSPALVAEVDEDLSKIGYRDLLEKFYALEELIYRYLEDLSKDEKSRIARALIASKMQIELAPSVKDYLRERNKGLPLPVHIGYATLSEIRERQGLYEEAIRLCQQAYSEGWAGDWLDRISRCRKTSIYRKDE